MNDDFRFGRDLTAAALGVDRLERAGPGGGDGLIPIYLGRDIVDPRAYADWVEALAELDALAARAAA